MLRRLLRKILVSKDKEVIRRHERYRIAEEQGLLGSRLSDIQTAEKALGITDSAGFVEERARMDKSHQRVTDLLRKNDDG